MLRFLIILFAISCPLASSTNGGFPMNEEELKYYGKESFIIEGTSIPESLKEGPFDRLPLSFKEKVRPPVWNLSKATAGITIRFLSNSSQVAIKWTLLNNIEMNHMPDTGSKGVDLYCKINGNWEYVNTGRPKGKENSTILKSKMPIEMREFKIYLPLYDGITNLEIGVDSLSQISKPKKIETKPIIFYGTSITQGGCASRPGMAFTNIISRKLDVECINFGFSGNGKMEGSISELLADSEALFYVIDCIPNMTAEQIEDNTIPLVKTIRAKRPETPIVFLESISYTNYFLTKQSKAEIDNKNNTLKRKYDELRKMGIPELYYISGLNAIGNDREATVDTQHFTDLGFMRFSDYLVKKFIEFRLIKDDFISGED